MRGGAGAVDTSIERGVLIVLATRPTTSALNRALPDGTVIRSGFGSEYDYLYRKGYRYDSVTSRMIPPREGR